MGFALQNRGGLFSLDPASPDALAGHKRPFHTIIPAFMQHGDEHIGFGIMGGMNQPSAHAQFVSNVVDYHMNIQAAMEEPASPSIANSAATSSSNRASRRPPSISSRRWGTFSTSARNTPRRMGRGQAVLHNSKTGVNYGASDPRADGAAIPETPKFTVTAP